MLRCGSNSSPVSNFHPLSATKFGPKEPKRDVLAPLISKNIEDRTMKSLTRDTDVLRFELCCGRKRGEY